MVRGVGREGGAGARCGRRACLRGGAVSSPERDVGKLPENSRRKGQQRGRRIGYDGSRRDKATPPRASVHSSATTETALSNLPRLGQRPERGKKKGGDEGKISLVPSAADTRCKKLRMLGSFPRNLFSIPGNFPRKFRLIRQFKSHGIISLHKHDIEGAVGGFISEIPGVAGRGVAKSRSGSRQPRRVRAFFGWTG